MAKWERKQPEIVNRLNKINALATELIGELAKREAKKIEALKKMQEMVVRNKEKDNG